MLALAEKLRETQPEIKLNSVSIIRLALDLSPLVSEVTAGCDHLLPTAAHLNPRMTKTKGLGLPLLTNNT